MNAYAVLPFLVDQTSITTDTGGSAIINPNINNNIGTNGNGTTRSIATGAESVSGTLNVRNVVRLSDDALDGDLDINFDFNVTGTSTTNTSMTSNGTATLQVINSNNSDNGGSLFNSFQVTDLEGVTEFTLTFTYSELVGGRTDAVASSNRPLLAGAALNQLGTGVTLGNISADISLANVFSSNAADGPFVSGLPSTAVAVTSANLSQDVVGGTDFTGTFGGTVPLNQANDVNYLVIRGFDLDGNDMGVEGPNGQNIEPFEFENALADTITFTISTSDADGFDDGTLFIFSVDGDQFSSVPEPTGTTLLGLGAGLLLLRRKRK